jgi:acyl-CoA thioester hydrolase
MWNKSSEIYYPWSGPKLNPKTHIAETTFHVRYAETDKMGIVHHSAYIIWLEEGRSQWLRSMGSSYAAFEEDGVSLAVSEVNVRYAQAAVYDQRVTVRSWIEEVKSRKVTFGYEILDAASGAVLVSGTHRHICLNRQGGSPLFRTNGAVFKSVTRHPRPGGVFIFLGSTNP